MSKRDKNQEHGGSENKFRLPRGVWPKHYDISLTPDLHQFTFSGFETIEIDVREPVSQIVLNARDLEIQEASVVSAGSKDIRTGKVSLDEESDLATIEFAETLAAGSWKLSLRFTGIHNDKLKGFYRSSWTGKDGEKHAIVTTQFESTDARRCFPCFDEPEFKATYKCELIVDENLTAISNTRVLSETLLENAAATGSANQKKKSVKFAQTQIPLSTYLVAFIVGEFVSTEPVVVNGVEVRIWTVPGKEHLTKFAVECATKAVAYYEKRNESKYPGDIINEIAIPDFSAGAMENWGCITYRETALLCDLEKATHGEKKRVAEVIFHEHGHMDFGDKVTMKWWNGLWLNESFATHGEAQALSELWPDWKIWEEFAISRGAAMRLDGLNSTHPIECPVNHPDEVAELFDLISYQKGCSVLYQIQQFMGDEIFRQGVVAYIDKHAFKNTETHDLWDALEESARKNDLDIPVRKIMDAWVFISGHPVVSVEEGKKPGSIELTQQLFKFLPEGGENVTWPIPVTMAVKNADGTIEEKKFVFENKTESYPVKEGYEWVKINAGGSGFYRARYATALMQKLTDNIQENLSTVERFNLVNDTWSGVRAGIISTSQYLEMVKKFVLETDPNVWAIILGSLRTMDMLLTGPARTAVRKEIAALVKPAFAKLGYEARSAESVQDKELRASLLSVLGTIGEDDQARSKARQLFESWKKDSNSIDSNLLPALVSILAYNGDKARYDEFFELFKTAKTPQEEQRFLQALTAFRNPELLEKSIVLMLSDHVRTQDAPYIFGSLLRNEVCGEAAWKFMCQNWEKMVKAYPESGIVRMIGGAESLDRPELEEEVRQFFAKNPVKAGDMATAQMLEQLRINVRLRESQAAPLAAYILASGANGDESSMAMARKEKDKSAV
jgi:puromycin-sensitive aminopeptidase